VLANNWTHSAVCRHTTPQSANRPDQKLLLSTDCA